MDMLDHRDATNLVALHVLLEERHVTRAARRLGITQSSMSHRLARLRDALQDPLFVRSAGGLLPTPRAGSIARPLAEALRALEAVERFQGDSAHRWARERIFDIVRPALG